MKNVLILILFITNICFAQKHVEYLGFDSATQDAEINYLQGSWGIDLLITQKPAKEYNLFKRDESQNHHYGNNIIFNPDGTFSSGYSAPCSMDCFVSTIGRYKVINESYICIFLEHEWRHGQCDFSDIDSINKISEYDQKLNLDLGLFRVYKDTGRIQIFKSDGNPEKDKKNLQYIEILTQKSEEISNCFPSHRYLNWYEMIDYNRQTNVSDIVNFISNQLEIKDYQILYDRDYPNEHLILLKMKNEFRFVLWKNSSTKVNAIDVALYDDSFFEDLDSLARKTDKDKTLKKEVIKELEYSRQNAQLKNTITIFSKNGEHQKLIYDMYTDLGYFKLVFYIKDGKLSIVKIENEKRGNFTYYVFNLELSEGAVMKPIVRGWTFSGVSQTYYRIMELIKK